MERRDITRPGSFEKMQNGRARSPSAPRNMNRILKGEYRKTDGPAARPFCFALCSTVVSEIRLHGLRPAPRCRSRQSSSTKCNRRSVATKCRDKEWGLLTLCRERCRTYRSNPPPGIRQWPRCARRSSCRREDFHVSLPRMAIWTARSYFVNRRTRAGIPSLRACARPAAGFQGCMSAFQGLISSSRPSRAR